MSLFMKAHLFFPCLKLYILYSKISVILCLLGNMHREPEFKVDYIKKISTTR